MGPRKTNEEWWDEKIQQIIDYKKDIEHISPEIVTHSSGRWTPQKLVVLAYYFTSYCTILYANGFKKYMYVDLFSGSGINEILREDKGKVSLKFAGSPIISIFKQLTIDLKKRFAHMVFHESVPSLNSALTARLGHLETLNDTKWIKNRYTIMDPKDINDQIDDTIRILDKNKSHALIFIDPTGLDVHWKTMEKILKNTQSDLFIYYHAAGAKRLIKAALTTSKTLNEASQKSKETQYSSAVDFFGHEEWITWETEKEFLDGYIQRIEEFRPCTRVFEIKDKDRTQYYIILQLRKKALM